MSDNHNLNQGQKAAADAFLGFLFDPDSKEFNIAGAAGVGKTHLMNYLIDQTMPRYLDTCKIMDITPEYTEVVMTATTNKAAEVLGQSTKRPTSTVHSYFRLKLREDFSTGTTHLTKRNDWTVHEKKIIFIDECSMIDTPLWKILHEGTQNCKLVYVGDHNQLAPVQETLSPIYRHETPFFELTQPMRNSGQPALMNICQQLRETVATGDFKPIQLVPGTIDLLDDQDMMDGIEHFFEKQTLSARILAYTNKRVIEYNDHIRQNLRHLPDRFTEGELLVNNQAMQINKNMLSVEAEVEVVRNGGSDQIFIDKGVELDIDYIDIKDNYGHVFSRVMSPTNRDHYNALVKYYARIKNWERMFFLKNSFVDLRPRDAATVHKSQGSTYDTVFIDIGNISTCNFPDQVARMLYVAFSRARQRVFLYGDLANKYGGLISP